MARTVTVNSALPGLRRLVRGRGYLPALAAVLAVTLLVRVPSFLEPAWHDDEGIFAAVGRTVAQGGTLYVDAWDNKPPLIYLAYAGWYAAFGFNVAALRLLTALPVLGTQVAVFAVGRRLWGTRRGLAAALLLGVLMSAGLFQGNDAFTETLMVLPVTVGMLAYAAGRSRAEPGGTGAGFVVLAGALLGVAFQFKQAAALDAAALGIFVLLAEPRPWRAALALGGGWLAPTAVVVGAFALAGALDEYVYAAVLYYFQGGYLGEELALPGWAGPLRAVPPVLAVGYAVRQRRRLGTVPLETLVTLWVVFAVTGALITGRAYPHYLLQVFPPLALFAVRPWDLRRLPPGHPAGWAAAGVMALLLGLTFVRPYPTYYAQIKGSYYLNVLALVRGEKSVEEYRGFFDKHVVVERVREYLEAEGLAGRAVYVWADVPWLYAAADVDNPTRYPAAYHVRADREAQEEVVGDLRRDPPEAILKDAALESFPELDALIAERYEKADEIGPWGEHTGRMEVYRPRAAVRGP